MGIYSHFPFIIAPTSPYSLYSEELATFGEDEIYDQKDSAGFIHLFGLPITVQAKRKQKWEE